MRISFEHIIFFIISFLAVIFNIIGLRRAVRFRGALKDGKFTKVTAEIISAYGGVRGYGYLTTTRYAKARYSIDGKSVVGKMIGPYVEGMFRLRKGLIAEVIVNCLYPNMFAFSEKQVRRSFREYLLWMICASFLAAAIALDFFGVYKIW